MAKGLKLTAVYVAWASRREVKSYEGGALGGWSSSVLSSARMMRGAGMESKSVKQVMLSEVKQV